MEMEMEMGLKEIGERLPPGFRFYPSDEELVCHYLRNKLLLLSNHHHHQLTEIDLHTCEPWQLPDAAMLNANEWYFFSFRDRKYATGFRTNRATRCGYWKATGKDRVIVDPSTGQVVGMRKTLVFYMNRAPNGMKTGWIMHEFRLESPHMPPKEDWVLCRVFHKSKGDQESTNQDPLSSQSTEPENHQATMTTYGSQGLLSFESNPSSQPRGIRTHDPNSLVQDSSLFDPNYNLLPLLEDDGPSTSFNFNNAGMTAAIDAPKTIDLRNHDHDGDYRFFRDLGFDGSNELERGALASYHHQFGGRPGI